MVRLRLLAYLRLFRAPNVFTSIADIATGFLVVSGSLQPWWQFAILAVASAAMYSAGMVLNDVFDYDDDLRLRPHRPLPAGQIPRKFASQIGFTLLFSGAAAAAIVGFAAGSEATIPWRSGAVAAFLVASIWLYDGVLKATVLGPILMGSCRLWNLLLGMSLGPAAAADSDIVLGFDAFQLAIAVGIGTYIVGVTLFARREAEGSSRGQLACGLAIMAIGIGCLMFAPRWAPSSTEFQRDPRYVWPLILVLLTFPILRRCLAAIAGPTPGRVQAAVKVSILSLIVLDASIVMLTCPWYWAVIVVSLLLPTLVLGKWVYST